MKRVLVGTFIVLWALNATSQTSCGKREIKIGVNINAPPFGFVDARNDTVGVDIEIANLLAKKLHAKAEIIPIFGAQHRQEMLHEGRLDFVVAIYSITEERKKHILFSHPYYATDNAISLMVESDSEIETIDDLVNFDYGVVEASTSDDYQKNVIEKLFEKALRLPSPVKRRDQEQVFRDFFSGKTEGLLNDTEVLHYWSEQYPGKYRFVPLPDTDPDTYGIGINKKDSICVSLINEMIDSLMKEDAVNKMIKKFHTYRHQSQSQKSLIGWVILALALVPIFLIIIFRKKPAVIPVDFSSTGGDKQINVGSYFAWIIANNNYEHQNDLNDHPLDDANALCEALDLYGYKRENIHIQKNAKHGHIVRGFTELAAKNSNDVIPFATRITKRDNLLIYYTGHGDFKKTGNLQIGYWVPTDAKDFTLYIRDTQIKSHLNEIEMNQILLVSDSCFAGKLLNGTRVTSPAAFQLTELVNPCIEIITSGNNRVPSESLFAKVFVELLKTNTKPYFTTDEIALRLKDVLRESEHYFPQYGTFSKSILEGRFVFVKQSILEKIGREENPASKEESFLRLFDHKNRFLNYYYVKSMLNMNDEGFDKLIEDLRERGLIRLEIENRIFITIKGLNQYHDES